MQTKNVRPPESLGIGSIAGGLDDEIDEDVVGPACETDRPEDERQKPDADPAPATPTGRSGPKPFDGTP